MTLTYDELMSLQENDAVAFQQELENWAAGEYFVTDDNSLQLAERMISEAKLYSMADGSVGTVNYKGNLYEVRVTPVRYGMEKWSHPKGAQSK